MNMEILDNFIEDRFQSNYPSLFNNAKYLSSSKKLDIEYKLLISQLSKDSLHTLENIMSIKNDLMTQEIYLSYKVGFADGFNFKNEIN